MMERRTLETRPSSREARPRVLRYRTVSGFLADYDRSLSRGWVFLNARQPLRVGARVRLTISLGRTSVRNIPGRVTRTASFGNQANEVPGMRIELGARRRLQQIASRIRADAGMRTVSL